MHVLEDTGAGVMITNQVQGADFTMIAVDDREIKEASRYLQHIRHLFEAIWLSQAKNLRKHIDPWVGLLPKQYTKQSYCVAPVWE